MTSPPASAAATWRSFAVARSMALRPGVFHSEMRRSPRTWRMPSPWTWRSALSARSATSSVGAVARKPLSVTSSTVSPMESTSVAFVNDTTMYLS